MADSLTELRTFRCPTSLAHKQRLRCTPVSGGHPHVANKNAAQSNDWRLRAVSSGRQARVAPLRCRHEKHTRNRGACQKQGPPNFRTRGLKCHYGRLLSLVRRGPEFLGPGLDTSMAIHAVPTALYHNVVVVSRNGRLKTLYVSPSYFTEPSMPRPAKIPVNIPHIVPGGSTMKLYCLFPSRLPSNGAFRRE